MKELDTGTVKMMLLSACDEVIENEAFLTELDTIAGDGDHGISMKEGFSALRYMLYSVKYESLFDIFRETGVCLLKAMGGASGVIFGTMFIGGLPVLKKDNGEFYKKAGSMMMTEFFERGAADISRRGRVSAGDRTMLDALLAAVSEMKEKSAVCDIKDTFFAAWKGAEKGTEATKQMLPSAGRSKNFRERVLGYPDPGAVSVSLIFKGMYCGISGEILI